MTDAELIATCTEFRRGLLGRRSPRWQCAKVCWAMAPYLEFFHQVTLAVCMSENVEFARGRTCNHVWLQLADGRVLDPTADQFSTKARPLPAIYLGEPIPDLHKGDEP